CNDYDNFLSSAKNEDTTVKDEQNENFKNSKDSAETGENITVYPEKTGQDNLGANRIIQESREIIFNISYDIKLAGSTSKIEFISSIPKDYLRRQGIKAYSFSLPEPQLFYSGDNYYAKFIINNPKDNFLINIQTDMVIYEYSLGIASKPGSIIDKKPQNLQKYLKNENFIEKDDEAIIAVAQSFKNPDQVELVGEIYNFVLSNMEYSGYNPSSAGAVSALLEGKGDCTEYSDLFVALCRAKGIAARTVEGYTTDESIDYISLGHNWSEVFFDNYGWVPFDTIYDDNNGNSSSTTFYNLKNIYIYTGFERNDKILFNYHYYAYTYYGDNIEVNKKITVIEKNNG
ncbi:MAG: transglutaminase domain-containing protein, partial [Actinobacteria bacterium]|nr:transglutaminase domain-containing protein [Actinomycetota bacterium]